MTSRRPVRGDARQPGGIDVVARAEELQRRGNEIEAVHVAVGGDEGIDLGEPRPARDPAQQRAGDGGAAAAEPVRETLPEALFELDHAGGPRPCWAEPAPAMRRSGCAHVAAQ